MQNFDLEKKWQYLYQIYPINQELIWLNNCGISPINEKTIYEIQNYLQGFATHSVLTKVNTYEKTKENIKRILSKLISCSPDELCIIHNTNEGLNFISHGVRLEYGDEILLLENEYPSNVYPWEHWKNKNVGISFISLGKSQEEFLKNFKKKINNKTKLVSLSAVHWCNGMPLPLQKIGRICQIHNIHFVLDGAQGVGHVPINVKLQNISFAAFPAWKWLLGPLGLGVLYINQNKLDKLKFEFKGTSSVVNDQEYLPYKSEIKSNADRYEISTCNFLDWVYFESTLKILDEIGFSPIMQQIYQLTNFIKDALIKKGYEVDANEFSNLQTGIITFKKPEVSTENLFQILQNHKIVCPIRLGKIRFSPHVYNSIEQLEKVVEILP